MGLLSQATDTSYILRRQIHEQYSVPQLDYPAWVLGRWHWRDDEYVLDLGSGLADYHARFREFAPHVKYYSVDLSAETLLTDSGRFSQANILALPFPAHSFDVVLANHVLHFIRDIDAGLREIQRVLKPGGLLLTATSSINTMPQFYELYRRSIMVLLDAGQQASVPLPASYAFSLESGTRRLARHFHAVIRYDFPSSFVFTDVEPVMRYIESKRSFYEPQLPQSVEWPSLMLVMREQVRNHLQYANELIVHKLNGVLLAVDEAGFVARYDLPVHKR